ncbi:helix-turn-helix domain-containing protein [Lacrimispora sp. NSJ-141]|uniref:Helix-turn-helix domain-containing protein n=1 Tax=Lientehia hominis TaxID=2897778 RepID=A0AAP2RID2_9FIRM|nr:helix-turn-helix transcriptional regulator [Lientehia hominis]MCD2492767.1 helix-turn-helix domain-containing protein [Lientehia hominis]
MKDRIRMLRKSLKLTQTKFGEIVGVKGNTITNYENGLRMPSDAVIFSICREFDVNEDWLRNGLGDMFIQKTRGEQIAEFAADVLKDEEDSFRHRFIEALAELSVDEWEVLEKIVENITKERD